MNTVLVLAALAVGYAVGHKVAKSFGKAAFNKVLDVFAEELGEEKIIQLMNDNINKNKTKN